MSYHLKLKIKFLWFNILGLIIIATICVIAYFNDRLIETSITIILFYLFRGLFEKQYHASSLYLCGLISICVFTVVIHLEVSISISILASVVLTFIMTLISYYVRDYFDNKILVKTYETKLKQFDGKCLENLTEDELLYLMPKIRRDIIHTVYGYLHKSPDVNASGYAYRNHISDRTLYRYLKLIKDTYESLQKM